MIRLTVTLLSLAFFVAVTIRMALDGFFHPADWHAAIGMIASFSCLTILLLLIQACGLAIVPEDCCETFPGRRQ